MTKSDSPGNGSIHHRLILVFFSFVISITLSFSQSSWNQLGADIAGGADDGLGESMAMSADGSIVAIGAPSANSLAGNVKVYQYIGSSWQQLGDDMVGSQTGDSFGSSVSLSADGSVVAVGARTADGAFGAFSTAGYVKVYEYNALSDSWQVRGSTLNAQAEQENFGNSVSLSSDGNVIGIGAPGAAGAANISGTSRVYEWNTTSWVQVGTDIDGDTDFESSGLSVSLMIASSDTIMAIGSPSYTLLADYEGRVRIFTLNNGSWGTPEVLLGNAFENLGTSVSLSADATRLAVGAPYDLFLSPGPSYIGKVNIYEFSTTWSMLGTAITSNLDADNFGKSVAISADGTHVIIGAPTGVTPDSPGGRVEIWTYDTDWTQVGDDIIQAAENSTFGTSVVISGDGSIAGSGSPIDDGSTANGYARVYDFGVPDNTAPVVTVDPLTTNNQTPALTGTIDDNTALISITVGSQTKIPATNNGDGTWTLAANTLTTLAEGTYDVMVSATDAANNTGTDATTDELVIDQTAPLVSVAPLITNDVTPGLTGTIDDATATISISVVDQTDIPAINNGDGTWTLADNSLAPLAEGTYDVIVSATDAANNTGTDATTDELVIDQTAPVVTINPLISNNQTPVLTGTIDDNTALISIAVGVQTNIPATNNADGTWTLTEGFLTALAEGSYDVAVTAIDEVGNEGSDVFSSALIIDVTKPAFLSIVNEQDSDGDLINDRFQILLSDTDAQLDESKVNLLSTGTIATLGYVTDPSSPSDLLVRVSGQSGENVLIEFETGFLRDAAGNESDRYVLNDGFLTTLSITAPSEVSDESPFTVTFAFNIDVTGFELSDITFTNALTGSLVAIDARTYTVEVTPTGAGNIDITVVEDAALHAGGDGNAQTISSVVFNAPYSGGTGTEMNPYLIANKEDLKDLSETPADWDKHFLQVADITLEIADFQSTGDFYNGGRGFLPIGRIIDINNIIVFTGSYDGGNFQIAGLTFDVAYDANDPESAFIGMFAYSNGGTLSNINLVDLSLNFVGTTTSAGAGTGGLVAVNGGNISNCHVSGVIIAPGAYNVGGLVGSTLDVQETITSIEIIGCSTNVSVEGAAAVGGLAGSCSSITSITDSYAVGDVKGNSEVIGGLIGESSGTITRSHAAGDVTGDLSTGGFIGSTSANIVQCYATGNVYCGNGSGGFAGSLSENGNIEDSYSTGNVIVNEPFAFLTTYGGFVGSNSGTITRCYTTGDLSQPSQENALGGFIGNQGASGSADGFWNTETSSQTLSSAGIGITSAQMREQSLFTNASWDFETVWEICGYPVLKWEQRTICPPVISGETTINIDENTTTVASYTADKAVTWSLSGTDSELFNIDTQGSLTFKIAPDFETPADGDADNIYHLIVNATAVEGEPGIREIEVTVTDADEDAPIPGLQIDETITAAGTPIVIAFSDDDFASFEEVLDFESSDITVINGTVSDFQPSTEIPNAFTAIIMPNGTLDVTVMIGANVVTDLAGNANEASGEATLAFNDELPPVVSVDTLYTRDQTPQLTGKVNDPSATISVTVVDHTYTADNNEDGTWTLADDKLTILEEGKYTISVTATDKFEDASEAVEGYLEIDRTPPTVSFYVTNLDASGNIIFTPSITYINNDNPIRVGIIFDEAIEGFDLSGVTLVGATKSNVLSYGIDPASGNDQYSIDATPDGSLADVSIVVNVGAVTDLAGNTSESGTYQVIYDATSPTVVIQGAPTAVSNDTPFPISIEFSEIVSEFTVNDLIIGNGTAGNLSTEDNQTYTADITPSGTGDITLDIPVSAAKDPAGNGNLATNQVVVIFDNSPPVVTINTLYTNNPTPVLTGTIDDAEANIDVSINGDERIVAANNGDGTWSLAVSTTLAESDYTITVTATDLYRNQSAAVEGYLKVDLKAPKPDFFNAAVTEFSLYDKPVNVQPLLVGIFLNDKSSDFALEDITITGNVGTTGLSYAQADNYYILAIPLQDESIDQEVTVTIPAGVFTDLAGNANIEGTVTIDYDPIGPNVKSIFFDAPYSTNQSPIPVQITFNEQIQELTAEDFIVGNGTVSAGFVTSDNITFQFDIIPINEGLVTVQLIQGSVQDLAGNDERFGTGIAETIYDNTPPTAEITTSSTVTTSSPITATVIFSESMREFSESDLVVTNGSVSSVRLVQLGLYTVEIVPDPPVAGSTSTSGVTVSASIPAGTVTDDAGNGNIGSNTVEVTFDNMAPVVSMTTQMGQPLATANGPFTAHFSFTESVNDFALEDLTVTNGTASNYQALNVLGTILYTVDFTPSGSENMTITVVNDAVKDNAGNPNTATEFTVIIDNQGPVVTISSTASNPTNVSPIPVTFTFDEEVNFTTFSTDDLVAGNFTASTFTTEDNITFTSNITPTAQGELSISLREGVVEDLVGNTNTETGSFTIIYDNAAPTVEISGATSVNSTNPITLTLTFSEAIKPLVKDSLTVSGATIGALTAVSTSVYTVELTPVGTTGTITLALKGFADPAGNVNAAKPSKSILFDNIRPTVTITGVPTTPVKSKSPVNVTFTFSESVGDFTIDDITVQNGTKANFKGSGTAYTADISPSVPGTITISLNENVATDAAGNGNLIASASFTFTQPYSGGLGTESDPYLIANGQDFIDITNNTVDWSSYFKQTADIDFADASFNQITDFSGNYDGGGFELKSFSRENSLFATLGTEGKLTNLNIINNYNITLNNKDVYFGVLVNDIYGLIENCQINGDIRVEGGLNVRASTVSGLGETLHSTGRIYNSKVSVNIHTELEYLASSIASFGMVDTVKPGAEIKGCATHGSIGSNAVSNGSIVAGIANNNEGLIENTFSDMILDAPGIGNGSYAGGIVRYNLNSGIIRNCSTNGTISAFRGGEITFNRAAGISTDNYGIIENSFCSNIPIVGYNSGTITRCFVDGNSFCFVGSNRNGGLITDCYSSTLSVFNLYSDGNEGGTIKNYYEVNETELGYTLNSQQGTVINSFHRVETANTTAANGALGRIHKDLIKKETYTAVGWDFTNTWDFVPNSYPRLKWQKAAHKEPFTVKGRIVDENSNAFTNGTVNAFSFVTRENSKNATIDASGNYELDLEPGEYVLSVFPNDFGSYERTYRGSTKDIQRTRVVFYGTSADIKMVPKAPNQMTGKGTASGTVVRSTSGSGRIVQGRVLEGEPIEGVTVVLVRVSDEEIMTSVVTDAEGKFEITGIPAGKYQLVLGVAGIDLNLEGSTFDMDEEGTPLQISAAVGENGVSFAVEEVLGIADEIEILVYPNPVSDLLNVRVEGAAKVRVLDLYGHAVKEVSFTTDTQIDVRDLPEGIHFIEITNDSGRSIRKLIKN